jgi:HK97 family phage major capsid protein
MTVKEMREKRAALAQQALEVAQSDPQKFEAIMADVDKLKGQIDRAERAEALDAELRATARPPLEMLGAVRGDENRANPQALAAHRKAFENYIRTGEVGELRTYTPMSDNVEGAYIAPVGFQNDLAIALKAYGGVREVATVLETATGNTLKWPTSNDTSNTGERLGENTTAGQANPTFSNISLSAWTYSTKMVNVSNQLLQDSAFDVEAFLRKQFVDRIGRVTNSDFTVGTGSGASMPLGISVAATAGPTSIASGLVSYDDMVELEHSLDRAYRKGAKFMLRDSVLKQIKKLKDSQGHPLWLSGVKDKAPDTILGYEYVLNDDLPAATAGNNLMLFGALDKYLIRSVKELAVIRLSERYAEMFQTAFIGFARFDGALIDAGTHPVKALVSA